jgi:uncharacterized protein YegP (UPF0339 family)
MAHRDKWELYTDKAGEWRWRRRATNGRIVGASTEGYRWASDCIDNAKRNGFTPKPSKADDMSKPPMYPIDHNPKFVSPNGKDSFVIRILRAILAKFTKREI